LVGKRFGRLTVINKDHVDKNGHQYYLCKCDCGNLVVVNSDALRRNLTTSCGCYHSEITHKRVFQDLTGQRFGQLTAIKPIFNKNTSVE
jgi:hypothetical protein